MTEKLPAQGHVLIALRCRLSAEAPEVIQVRGCNLERGPAQARTRWAATAVAAATNQDRTAVILIRAGFKQAAEDCKFLAGRLGRGGIGRASCWKENNGMPRYGRCGSWAALWDSDGRHVILS